MNFAVIAVFVALAGPLLVRTEFDDKPGLSYRLFAIAALGLLGVALLFFSVRVDEHTVLNFRGTALLLAAYFGGVPGIAAAYAITVAGRYVLEGHVYWEQIAIGFSAALATGVLFVKIRSYWYKWIVGTLFFVGFYYAGLWTIYRFHPEEIALYVLLQTICSLLVALFVKLLTHSRHYKQLIERVQRETSEMLLMQPGFTFKFIKEDGQFRYLLMEGQLLRKLGLQPDNMIGQSIGSSGSVTPELIPLMEEKFEKAWEGERISFEVPFAGFALLITLQPMMEDGDIVAVMGTSIDLSEHREAQRQVRESEERYRTLVENSQDFIVGFRPSGEMTSVNSKLCEAFRFKADDAVGRRLPELIGLDDVSLWEERFRETVELNAARRFELELRLPDRCVHVYQVTLSPFYSVNKELAGVACTMHDMTDLYKRKEADAANQAKSQFLARMSHEIRTPLSGIIGLTRLMHNTELSALQSDYMDKIESSSKALLGTINGILDFSKIEAGKIVPELVDFSPELLFRRLSDTLSVSVGKKQIEMMMDVPADLPAIVNGDRFKLEQVLLNLCNNAIKFTEHGHVIIRATMTEQGEKEAVLAFTVEDTGIGISEEEMAKLFSPFTQADVSTSRKYGGTGLGLVICQHLVQSMGGTIRVTSEPGQGSSFSFTMNVTIVERASMTAFEAKLDGLRAIVAEDHPEMREQLAGLLRSMRLQAERMSSCSDLIARLESGSLFAPPDFAVVDMEMDDMNGADTWYRLLETTDRSRTQLIALTTLYGREEMLRLPQEHRADAVLIKPVSRQSLHQTFQALAEKRSGQEHADRTLPERSRPPAKGSILVAEDNEINQLVVSEMLQQLGYSVTIAGNGLEALKRLQESSCDLLFMDLHMPEMDGYEATAAIRSCPEFNGVPIVALTANVMKSDHEQCLKLGMNDILTKPIDQERLAETIGKWIGFKGLHAIEGIDTVRVLRMLEGKAHICQHMLSKFQRDYMNFGEQLKRALAGGELAAAGRMIHTLRGVSANLYAERLLETVSGLEAAFAHNRFDAEWERRLGDTQSEIERIVRSIAKLSLT